MKSLQINFKSLKLGRKITHIQVGDYIQYNGAVFMFVAGDGRILKREKNWSEYRYLVITKTLVTQFFGKNVPSEEGKWLIEVVNTNQSTVVPCVGDFVKVIDPFFTKKYPLQGRVTEIGEFILVQFPCENNALEFLSEQLEVVSNAKPQIKPISEENPVNSRISKSEIARLKQLAIDNAPSPEPTSRLDQVKAAIAAGYTTPSAIAKFTGIHPSYVSTLLKKLS